MDDHPTFGGKIKQRRMELGITQETLAQRVGCAPITIQKIESGSRRASHQMATRIAASLSTASEDFAGFLAAARIPSPSPTSHDAMATQSSWCLQPLPTSTSLVGREQDVLAVQQLVTKHQARLITFIGPPGVGKSSLAMHVATILHEQFIDGVIALSLAGLADARLVPSTIGQVFGVRDTSTQANQDGVLAKLHDQRFLLVLDNMEHLLEAVPFVMRLLDELPYLTIFVTSRVRLGLTYEHCYHVVPLLLPEQDVSHDVATTQQVSAIALFVSSAQTYNPTFDLTEQNVADVVELCIHLDGLPLAIELAAAWIHILPISAMLGRMRHRLDWLRHRMNNRPAHQHTMRATLNWSYTLIGSEAQYLFRCMGVFVSGCSLESLSAVVKDRFANEIALLDTLGVLINHHLVTQVADTGEPRFVMLETIRDYAMEQLIASDHLDRIVQYQKDFFLSFTEEATAALRGPDQQLWLERLTIEHGNLRYVWDRAQFYSDRDTLLRLGIALCRFWWLRNHWTEGRSCLEQALTPTPDLLGIPSYRALLYAQVFNSVGVIAWAQDDSDAAYLYHTKALELCRLLKYEPGMAAALHNLGMVLEAQNEFRNARESYEASLQIKRRLGDTKGIAASLNNLGMVHLMCNDVEVAHTHFTESLTQHQQIGNLQGMAFTLRNLGDVATIKQDYFTAYDLYSQSLEIARKLDIQTTIVSKLHWNIGIVFCLQDEYLTGLHWLTQALRVAMSEDCSEGMEIALRGLAALFALLGETTCACDLFRSTPQVPRHRGVELIDAPLIEKAQQHIAQTLAIEVSALSDIVEQPMSLDQASTRALALVEQHQLSGGSYAEIT
ncbi:MAG: tetratricopeptide repeat protein [Chloroflexota bacterium]